MKKQWFIGAAMALIFAGPCVQAKSISNKAERDDITLMADADPAMQKAFALAQKTLPDFLREAANPKEGTSGYALKVGLTDGNGTEYFWMSDFVQKGDQFTATLANTPRMVRGYRPGQKISFKQSQIVDWMYMDAGKRRMMGNYTACALLSKEPAAEAEAFKKQYGLRCDH